MKNKITFAAIAPLIGGNPIGAEYAIGAPPEYVIGMDGFWGNDTLYMNWLNNTRGLNIPYLKITENEDQAKMTNVDVVIATCPCAGLSNLVTANVSKEKRGADAQQNEHMYSSTHFVLNNIKPKVLMGENAPALFTIKGRKVAEKLRTIAEQYGYSFSMYKTSTHLHGIPQARYRTFYFMWQSETVPELEWYDLPRDTFAGFLAKMPKGLLNDEIINPKLIDEFRYTFVQQKTGNARAAIGSSRVTAQQWIDDNGRLEEFIEWTKQNRTEKEYEKALHIKNKYDKGLGIWDGSVHVFGEVCNAMISRNMTDSLHPTEDRSLTIREVMYLMGMPNDFELVDGMKNLGKVPQNVPTCTAKSMAEQIVKYLNGELKMTNYKSLKQDNERRIIEDYETGKILQREKAVVKLDQPTLEEHFN